VNPTRKSPPISNPSSVSPLRRVSLVEQTVATLSELVKRGQWSETLPGEEALREQLSISRVTLRKALALLVMQGLLVAPGRGHRHAVVRRGKSFSAPTSLTGHVRCLSMFPETELVWSTRIIFDEIRKSLFARKRSFFWEQHSSVWRGNPAAALSRLTAAPDTAAWLLYRSSYKIQRWFQESGIPCIVLGPCHQGISLPSVQADVRALGLHLAGEAMRLGHRHLAFVAFDESVASSIHTLEGLTQYQSKSSAPMRVSVISDDMTIPGLRRSLSAAMRQQDPPTVVMVTEAVQILPVLGLLKEMGMRVPEDVSVVVRDHEPFLDRSLPEITRYACDWVRFGRAVVRSLEGVIVGGGVSGGQHKLLPDYIRGQTLAPRKSSV